MVRIPSTKSGADIMPRVLFMAERAAAVTSA